MEGPGGIPGNGVPFPLDEENNLRVTKTTALPMNSLRKVETPYLSELRRDFGWREYSIGPLR